MKYLSIFALLALVILALAGCATTDSYGGGTGTGSSTQ
jgi:outer membrane lipoprotein SlyB